MLLWNDIKEKAEEQLWVSVELEVIYRVESMPDADQPREILSAPIEDAGNHPPSFVLSMILMAGMISLEVMTAPSRKQS